MTSATSTPFCVTALLDTPLVLSADSFLTLDALLAAAVFKRTHDVEAAHGGVPLSTTCGIFHGSAAFVRNPLRRSRPGFKRGFQPVEEMWIQKLAYQTGTGKNSDKPLARQGRIDTQRASGHKSSTDEFMAYDTNQVIWMGCGNVDAVQDLLTEIAFIGKKSRQGYGQVAEFIVDEVDLDESLWSVRHGAARPTRPIPLPIWRDAGHTDHGLITRPCAARLPYFGAQPEMCVVPMSRDVKTL